MIGAEVRVCRHVGQVRGQGLKEASKGGLTMNAAEPRRSLDEIARLGREAFDRHVRPVLRPEDDGKFVAIDVDTGEYEIDADDYTAVTRMRGRKPTAETWLMRVGEKAAYKIRRDR
jgi:hypothetical protein